MIAFGFTDLPAGVPSPICYLTEFPDGTMRFRHAEQNPVRTSFFEKQLKKGQTLVPVELIHSRIVLFAENADVLMMPDETPVKSCEAQADGILTGNRSLVPVVTVADCMPIWFFDPETGCFGVLHSGWKGTGIASEAVKEAGRRFGSKPENLRFVLGPHIESCCYEVDEERCAYFRNEFTPSCITGNRLSLAVANNVVLTRAGVLPEHIFTNTDCTCCTQRNGVYPYASFRRQKAAFTPMAAFISW